MPHSMKGNDRVAKQTDLDVAWGKKKEPLTATLSAGMPYELAGTRATSPAPVRRSTSPGQRKLQLLALESGLDDTVTNGIQHQAGCLVNIQLLHQPGAMRFGRFHPDAEQRGNIFCGFSFCNQLQHLSLA